jgi:hypothetical protein
MSYLHDTKCEFQISTARHVRIFWGFRKGGLVSCCLSFEYQHTKFHGSTSTGEFCITSEIWTSTILEWLKLRD